MWWTKKTAKKVRWQCHQRCWHGRAQGNLIWQDRRSLLTRHRTANNRESCLPTMTVTHTWRSTTMGRGRRALIPQALSIKTVLINSNFSILNRLPLWLNDFSLSLHLFLQEGYVQGAECCVCSNGYIKPRSLRKNYSLQAWPYSTAHTDRKPALFVLGS